MPRTAGDPAPRRRQAARPRALPGILQAVRDHFYAHGLERASVDAIAADAGVSKMTIYSHFGSKEALEGVVRERTQRVVGGIEGAESLDPKQSQKALLAVGEQFLPLTRESDVLAISARCRGGAARGVPRVLPSRRRSADRRSGARGGQGVRGGLREEVISEQRFGISVAVMYVLSNQH
jgi:TetR/AcrR family transcriptional repressor of mexJK operon